MSPETMWHALHPDYPKSRLLDPPGASPYPQDYPTSRLLDPPAAPQTYPHMPWPRPHGRSALRWHPCPRLCRGPRAVLATPLAAPPPSLFTAFDRPNMTPQNSAQGRQGAPQMGMLDLSRLFGGGQPAAAAVAARPDLAQRVPLSQTPLPPRRPVDAPLPPPRPKSKSSSSSQGGGY